MPKLSQVEIFDTYGCEHIEFKPKTWTWITGMNGRGKSTILRAIAYIFEGGTDPGVIRKGADVSIVNLWLDDGTTITKTTRAQRARDGGKAITGYISDLEVMQPDGTPRKAPKSYIEELSKSVAIDPSIILRIDSSTAAGKKQLAAEFTKLIPIMFDRMDIERAFCIRFVGARPAVVDARTNQVIQQANPKADIPGDPMPIPEQFAGRALDIGEFKQLHAAVTEQRRRIGTVREDSDGAVKRLKVSLPAEDGANYDAALETFENEQREILAKLTANRASIQRDKEAAIGKATENLLRAGSAVDSDIDLRIRALEIERQDKRKVLQAQFDKDKELFNRVEQEAIDQIIADAKPHQDRITAAIATTRERRDAHVRAAGIREQIDIHSKAYSEADRTYTRLSEVLKMLEDTRQQKLENLPIPGLTVEDGKVLLGGIEWQNVNLAKRVEVVLQICTQLAGELQLLLIDDCEHMDRETRAAIEGGLAEAGWQVIAAMVSDDGPVRIETREVMATA